MSAHTAPHRSLPKVTSTQWRPSAQGRYASPLVAAQSCVPQHHPGLAPVGGSISRRASRGGACGTGVRGWRCVPTPPTIGGDCSLSPQKPGDSPPLVGLVSGGSTRDDHCILWRRPVKRFVCAELHPGCDRVFTGPTDQAVLDQVLAHAAADHGLPRPSMAFIERVVIATHPLTPDVRQRRRLTLVGAAPRIGPARSPVPAIGPVGGSARSDASGHGAAGPAATVTALTDRPARAHRTYRHECWLYDGDAEFVDMMVPFIRDGLARDQPVMVAVPQPRLHALRDALGGDAEKVVWADMADLGANPARIIPAWQEFTEQAPRRPAPGPRDRATHLGRTRRRRARRSPVPRGAAEPGRRPRHPAVAALPVRHQHAPGRRHRRGAAQSPGARRGRRLPRQHPLRRRPPREHPVQRAGSPNPPHRPP